MDIHIISFIQIDQSKRGGVIRESHLGESQRKVLITL
jgi:hypothetical protein